MFYCVLVERIVAIVIHDGHIYIYTNVPVHEAIDVCADLLFNHVLISGVDKDTFF